LTKLGWKLLTVTNTLAYHAGKAEPTPLEVLIALAYKIDKALARLPLSFIVSVS
jgi:hypothetical protein